MTEDAKHKQIIERVKQLRDKRGELISLTPEKALQRILDDPRAVELVHSFPDQDLYLLVRQK